MAKFSDVIAKAKQGDQNTSKPESQETGGNTESQKTRKPEPELNQPPLAKEEEVNLSIKVTKKRRQHWAAEAKRHGTTLTAVVTEALSTRFGEP